ncbi:15032_t:CDS:2 [Cetraspora pellucida]|uniref:15032_t:CDS:1 n=1 Tax=Cetraspora pellucida TaxID=1433469 RepID=A0A9N9GN44_9GLOM|nr:15032_t:CDS:2 [Cetraspora pellucida]
MAGYKRNQEIFQTSNSNDNENNLVATSSSGAQQTKRKRTENNDKESICWKYFEPFKVPKENGTVTKCTIPGCTTSYIWCGSTSNHVGHLKTKHGIMKSSTSLTALTPLKPITSTISFNNPELEINIPLIKFIISSGAPFSIVDNLKSAGFVNPDIELSTSNIIEGQINKAYNRLFLQLKSKAQQEKSIMLSICEIQPDDRIGESYVVITCNWLTKDFEFHKILFFAKKWFSNIDQKDYYKDIIEALLKLEFANLKFYNDDGNDFFELLHDCKYANFLRNLTRLRNCPDNLNYLIEKSLSKWAIKNGNTQGMFEITKAIKNATTNLCGVISFLKSNIDLIQKEIQNMQITFDYSTIMDIQNAKKISCNCIYHKIEFLSLIENPFIQLVNNYDNYKDANIRKEGKYFKELMLDSLPFGIFSKLLQVLKPLEHITCSYRVISTKEYNDLLDRISINANNMLKELQFSKDLEHEILKSFLIFSCYEENYLFIKRLASFLDPRSKPDEISPVNLSMIKEFTLKKCQTFYLDNIFSDNLDKSMQAANEELKCYINRPQLLLDSDINPYEWWQGSKQMLPGLAALAREYLPTQTMYEDDPVKNLDKLIKTHEPTQGADIGVEISISILEVHNFSDI